jgi:hypothetical protein
VKYLVAEALLRLIKPGIALLLGALLFWFVTGPLGEPGTVLLGLACWISAAVFVMLLETGLI